MDMSDARKSLQAAGRYMLENDLALDASYQPRPFEVAGEVTLQREVEQCSAHQGDPAHRERQSEPVPDGQAVGWQQATHHGPRCRIQKLAHRPRWQHAHHQTG